MLYQVKCSCGWTLAKGLSILEAEDRAYEHKETHKYKIELIPFA